jgi:hypothetical protein
MLQSTGMGDDVRPGMSHYLVFTNCPLSQTYGPSAKDSYLTTLRFDV